MLLCWGERPPPDLGNDQKVLFCFPLMGRVGQFALKPYLSQLKFYKSSKPRAYSRLHNLQCLHMLLKEANVSVADANT